MAHEFFKVFFLSAFVLLPRFSQAEMSDFEVAETLLIQNKPKLAYPLAVSYAQELDSYDGYRTFVKKFPQAPQRPEIYNKAFEKIKQIHSEKGYDDFIGLIPLTPQNFMAIGEQYKLFREMDAISEYERFIKKFPNTPEAAYALERIYEIAFGRAKEADIVEVYDQYIRTFPYAGQVKNVQGLALDAERRNIARELKGGWADSIRSYFGSNQQQREAIATRVFNEGRQAEKTGEMFIAKRKYDILQAEFKDTKALTEFLNREERLGYEKAMTEYQERIINEVRSVKSAVDVQTRAVSQAFQQMREEIREVGNSVSYLSGGIAQAVNMQTEAIERARNQAVRETERAQYANEQMFRRAEDEARSQSYKNRRCAEVLSKHGKYPFLSGCP